MPRPLVLPPAVKCEITGHTIYTVREKNLEVREEINRRCLADHGFRSEILRASMASCRVGDSAASGSSSRYKRSGPKRCCRRQRRFWLVQQI